MEALDLHEVTAAELAPNLQEYWKKAQENVQLKNPKYAITLLQAILKEVPGFYEGRQLLRDSAGMVVGLPEKKKGLVLSSSGSKFKKQAKKDPGGALAALEKELEKQPYDKELNNTLHEIAKSLGMPNTAAIGLEAIRKGHPTEQKLLHKLAEYYREIEEPAKAAIVYGHIVQHHPADIEAVKGEKDATANASMLKSRTSSGELVLKKADEAQTLELEKRSRAAMTRDQLEEKRDGLIEQYNADQNNLAVVRDLAKTYEELEEFDQAAAFYSWGYEISNGDNTLRDKAFAMSSKHASREIEALEAALADDPDNEELRQQLEETRSSYLADQVQTRRERVEQNPTDAGLRFELGEALYHLGEYSEAIPHLQQATRNPHIRTKVLLTLGRTFAAKGMNDLAVKQLSDANQELTVMDTTKKEILYELGLIHKSMGQDEEALSSFKQIYEVDYGYRDVAQRVEGAY